MTGHLSSKLKKILRGYNSVPSGAIKQSFICHVAVFCYSLKRIQHTILLNKTNKGVITLSQFIIKSSFPYIQIWQVQLDRHTHRRTSRQDQCKMLNNIIIECVRWGIFFLAMGGGEWEGRRSILSEIWIK